MYNKHDTIFDLRKKAYELERELLALAKLPSMTVTEYERMVQVKNELRCIENEVNKRWDEQSNWSCSYAYQSKNGKVSKCFMVNGKEVDEETYRRFFEKVSDITRNSNMLFHSFGDEFNKVVKKFFNDFSSTKLLEE